MPYIERMAPQELPQCQLPSVLCMPHGATTWASPLVAMFAFVLALQPASLPVPLQPCFYKAQWRTACLVQIYYLSVCYSHGHCMLKGWRLTLSFVHLLCWQLGIICRRRVPQDHQDGYDGGMTVLLAWSAVAAVQTCMAFISYTVYWQY